jgi:hypothetical protein
MHRMTARLVAENRSDARLLTYECLSTIDGTGPQTAFAFYEDLMERKCAAIVEHHSMRERRKFPSQSEIENADIPKAPVRAERPKTRAADIFPRDLV